MTARQQLNQSVSSYGHGMKRWYNEVYLRSRHWMELRAAKYEDRGRKCERCPCRATLQIHHNNYQAIYDVTLQDLEVLCRECHEREHGRFQRAYEVFIVTTPSDQRCGARSEKKRRAAKRRQEEWRADRDKAMRKRGGGATSPKKTKAYTVAMQVVSAMRRA